MRAGDIVFIRGKSPISFLIRLFDKGDFSHVAMAVSENHIIESEYFAKVQIREIDYSNYEIVHLDLTKEQRDKIVHSAIKLIGRRYDYTQIMGYMVSRRFGTPDALICSELVYILLKSVGLNIGDRFIKPNELFNVLTKGGI